MVRSHSPIRIEKIDEVKQMLEKNDYFPTATILQKINFIFINRKKHFDREEGEKGLSIKELALILYPHLVTINQMLAGPNDPETFNHVIIPTIKKTKNSILRFRKWSGNKEVNLFPLKSNKGEWLYHNIQNDKDMKKVEMSYARLCLAAEKRDEKIEEIVSLRPKEVEARDKKFLEKRERSRIKNMKRQKTWDGKPVYQDIDFTGINLIDLLSKNQK